MNAEWFVERVCPQDDYTLVIDFVGGHRRIFDAHKLLADAFYAPLKSIDFFKLAHREGRSVVWNDEIDIAPEYLYENSHECPSVTAAIFP